jgi:glucokinase
MTTPYFTVGLDIGGTAIKAGVVDSHRGQTAGMDRMCEAIRRAVVEAGMRMPDIAAIGVASAGLLDLSAGVIIFAPNLQPWNAVPVRQYIAEVFGLPTAFLNDAKAASLGESWVGAGRGSRSMVLFTLGTGIGGGIVLNDRVLEGEHGHASELGHIRVELTRPRACPCGRLGCLEAYAGAKAVVERTREALADPARVSTLRPLADNGLTARHVFEAAVAGDGTAEKIVEETAFFLAVGAVNLMHTLDPDMVVFGGGMAAAGETFLDRIRRHVRRLAFPVPAERTRIVHAELGDRAGVIGAAAAARRLATGRS